MINAKDSKDTFYLLNKKQKTPIVLIHGVGLNHTIWKSQIHYFDNTVLAYDILGHGKTSLNKNIISFDDFSDQLLNLINELIARLLSKPKHFKPAKEIAKFNLL